MTSVFCTLFDSNYLDKGLALYWSMKKHIKDFRLYVFAFDNKCYKILTDLKLKNVTVIHLREIMTPALQQIQKERTRAEICWTCTPIVIEYVLIKCEEDICTYIDADIYFFSSPAGIIKEIVDKECSVGLVRHGFERNCTYGEGIFKLGKYCIQFNTFLNNTDGMQVLEEWKKDCLDWCYYRFEDGKLGDQKYPDKWRLKYTCVYEVQDLGAGVAPWNLHLYTLLEKRDGSIWLAYKNRRFGLVFYHFEGMKYLSNGKVYLSLWNPCQRGTGRKVRLLYGEYFDKIKLIRVFLEDTYQISFSHMTADVEQVLGTKNLLKQFIVREGLFQGLEKWIGYKCNGLKNM